MRDQRPYLLRALNDWLVDSGCTPHLLVDASDSGVQVPPGAVEDGRVVLNIAPEAVRHLAIGDDLLTFEARFAGVARQVSVPLVAVLAIYARENGAGMAFNAAPAGGVGAPSADAAQLGEAPEGDDGSDPDDSGPSGGGHLRVVK